MATLSEKQAKLFTDRNWGVIATIREDGSPQATPVWIDYDGENVLVNVCDPFAVATPLRAVATTTATLAQARLT
jgi:hypothetical protein